VLFFPLPYTICPPSPRPQPRVWRSSTTAGRLHNTRLHCSLPHGG
jgi:hypothetical protein